MTLSEMQSKLVFAPYERVENFLDNAQLNLLFSGSSGIRRLACEANEFNQLMHKVSSSERVGSRSGGRR